MGLIKVLPEHKKRKRAKREVEQVSTKETETTNIPVGNSMNPYTETKEVHVTVGEGGIEISERPKGYEEKVVEQDQNSTVEVATEEKVSSEESFDPANLYDKSETPLDVDKEKIIVPELFMKWLEETDRKQGVFKAYSTLANEGEQELVDWVDNHQDEFMLIWKGELIPEVEEALYETAMFNYGKYPNVLVKTLEEKIMMKTYEDMLSTDELHLTEEEIREDWTFLFENGFSKRVYFE